MKTIPLFLLLLCSVFAIEPIVTTEWLSQNLYNKDLRIIQVSDEKSYQIAHIQKALQTDIGKWRKKHKNRLNIRSAKEIEAEIRRLGIDKNKEVVLYAPITTPKDLLKTSYIYWALNYHGINKVALLEGGLNQWEKENLPISKKTFTVKPSTFKVKRDTKLIAHKSYILRKIGKVPMIDARPSDKYLGITATNSVKRDGHIKGAMSYTWTNSLNDGYKLKNVRVLTEVFQKEYKLHKDKETIVYCTGGLETSFNYFVLKAVLGYKNIRLYDASMKEWGNEENTPMTRYKFEQFSY